jgi:hypothetical protein
MSQPISNATIADLLEALGKPDAATNVRWSEGESGRRFENETEVLRDQLAAAEDELAHAVAENDRLVAAMCPRCTKKLEKTA